MVWINAPTAMILSLRKSGKGLFDLVPETGRWDKFFVSVKEEMSVVHPFVPGSANPYTVLGDEE